MAKKNNPQSQTKEFRETKKRKFHPISRLLSMILSLVMVVVVLAGTSFYLAYDYLARPITGMSMFEFLSTFHGLYIVDKDKIVTNPYDSLKDQDSFLSGLSDSLLLDTKLKMNDIINGIAGSFNNPDNNNSQQSTNPPVSNTETTGSNFFDELLKDAKFDFSSLKDYKGDKPNFFISDRMIASVLNEFFLQSEKLPQFKEIETLIGQKVSNVLDISQVLIEPSKDEYNYSKLSFTIHLNIKPFLSTYLAINGMDQNSINLILSVVPKEMYLTGSITPLSNTAPTFVINNISQQRMSKIITMIDNIMALEGKDKSPFSKILNDIGTKIYDLFKKIEDITGVGSLTFGKHEDLGNISLDSLQLAMHAMGIKNVKSNEFLYMLKHLHSIDNSGMSEQEYIDSTLTNASKIQDYIDSRDKLFGSYGINSKDPIISDKYSVDKFTANISKLSEDIDIVNGKINGQYLYNLSQEALLAQSRFTDKALAEVLKAELAKQPPEATKNIKIDIMELVLDGDNFVLTVKLNLKDMIISQLEGNPLRHLIASLFPEQLYAKVTAPEVKNPNKPSNIVLNQIKGNDVQLASDNMLKTLSSIVSVYKPDFTMNKEQLCKLIDDQIYKAIDTMTSNLNKLDLKISFENGYIQMPTFYEVIASQAKGQIKPTANDVQIALQDMYTTDSYFENGSIIDDVTSTNLNAFIDRELVGKLFFRQGVFNPEKLTNQLKSFSYYLQPEIIATKMDLKRLKLDMKKNPDLPTNKIEAIYFTASELAKIMQDEFANNNEIANKFKIYNQLRIVQSNITTDNRLRIVLCGKLNTSESLPNFNISNIAPQYMFINAYIKLPSDKSPNTTVSITINGTDSAQDSTKHTNNLFNILSAITGNSISSDTITTPVSSELDKVFRSMKKGGISFTPNHANQKLESTTLYDVLAKNIAKDDYKQGDDLLLRRVMYRISGDIDPLFTSGNIPNSNVTDGVLPDNKGNITIKDTFIAYQMSKALQSNEVFKLQKFAFAPKGSDFYSKYRMQSLINNGKTKDTIANVFEINTPNLSDNNILKHFLPEKIYATVVINKGESTMTDFTINNLDDKEKTYLITKLASSNDDYITNTINQALQTSFAINIPIMNNNITIGKLLQNIGQKSTFINGSGNGNYGSMTFKLQDLNIA